MKIQKKFVKYQDGGKAQNDKLSKLKSELDKVNDEINDVTSTKDVNTLMDEKAKKVAERRGLSRTEIIEGYLSPLQDKKDSLRNEISKIKKGEKGMKYNKGGKVKKAGYGMRLKKKK
jgi:predicted  nucleic acid-binding Zn-ribbon protein